MLAHGDEIGRTQHGNNNVYCQDNELSWVDWDLDDDEKRAARVHRRRRRAAPGPPGVPAPPVLRRQRRPRRPSELGDIAWFQPTGEPMAEAAWRDGEARRVMVFLNGEAHPEPDPRGQRVVDDAFLVLFNAHHEDGRVHPSRTRSAASAGPPRSTPAPTSSTPTWHEAGSELDGASHARVIVLRSPRETPCRALRSRARTQPDRDACPRRRTGPDPGRSRSPRATYRLQVHAGSGSTRRPQRRPTSPRSASPTLYLSPGAAGGAGLDARLRRRRPRPDQRPRPAGARRSSGCVAALPRRRPRHRRRRRAQPHGRARRRRSSTRRCGRVLRDGPRSPYAEWFDVDWVAEGDRS